MLIACPSRKSSDGFESLAEPYRATDDTAILSQVLRWPNTSGNFCVIGPMTGLWPVEPEWAGEQLIARVRSPEKVKRKHVDHLLERLMARNKKPARLTLTSSPKDGYLIDYGGKFGKYFRDGGGGWDRWFKENPKAHGSARVSLPAYDPKTGLVLIYMSVTIDGRGGWGDLILYKYRDGELEELGRVLLWT
jgi:hypothetical protein